MSSDINNEFNSGCRELNKQSDQTISNKLENMGLLKIKSHGMRKIIGLKLKPSDDDIDDDYSDLDDF